MTTVIEIETAFEQLNFHREQIAEIDKPIDHDIKEIDDEIDVLIDDLMERRQELCTLKMSRSATHVEAVDTLTSDIKEMVIENKKSCSTMYGTCTFVKGRKGAVTWNDAALNGAIAGNEDLDFLLDFRTEKPDGKPSTRFKLADPIVKED